MNKPVVAIATMVLLGVCASGSAYGQAQPSPSSESAHAKIERMRQMLHCASVEECRQDIAELFDRIGRAMDIAVEGGNARVSEPPFHRPTINDPCGITPYACQPQGEYLMAFYTVGDYYKRQINEAYERLDKADAQLKECGQQMHEIAHALP